MDKQAKHTTLTLAIAGALTLMSSGLAMASTVSLSNIFEAGQPATAASVNQNFTDVKTAVDDNDGRVTSNAAGISANTTAINANDTDIAASAAATMANSAAITANDSDIAANATAITAKDSDIAANAAAITANDGDIAANTAAITDNDTDIAANAAAASANTAAITDNDTDIAANAAAASANTAAITSNDSDIAENSTAITGNSDAIATLNDVEGPIAANTAAITANDGDIADNSAAIVTNSDAIAALDSNEGPIAGNSAAIAALNNDEGPITLNADAISLNSSAITVNSNAIEFLNGAEGPIATNAFNIDANRDDINGIYDELDEQIYPPLEAHETRITALEGAAGGVPSSADNPVINVNCTAEESLQAAIETAPIVGKTVIEISGACSDDIYLRRSGITIQGASGPETDSISGNSSGFSSDPLVSYNKSDGTTALVNKSLSAAFEMTQRARVTLRNLTINAGSNATALKAEKNSSLNLSNVVLNGGENGFGLHASNSDITITGSTVTGNGTNATSMFAGAAVLAETNTVMEIKNNNTFTGPGGDLSGFLALSGTTLRLTGGSNVFNPGVGGEPIAIEITQSSSLTQTFPGSGNQINGDIDVSSGSHVFLTSIAIDVDNFEIYDASSVILEPFEANAISINVYNSFEIGIGGTLDMGDDKFGVSINNVEGPLGTMRLLDHASLVMWGGSFVNMMNVELHRGSSVDAGEDSDIGGNLHVHGFSTFVSTGQTAEGANLRYAVGGSVSCGKGEAFTDEAGGAELYDACFFGAFPGVGEGS